MHFVSFFCPYRALSWVKYKIREVKNSIRDKQDVRAKAKNQGVLADAWFDSKKDLWTEEVV